MSGLVIALDGLPGVGKTTFGEALTDYLNLVSDTEENAIFLSEYVNNKLLLLYLSDMNKYSLMFQLAMLKEKAKTYELAAFYASQGKTVIIDRSHIGDLSFAILQKRTCGWTENEYAAYISCLEEITPPHLIVYLQVDVNVAYERMLKRGRIGESSAYSKQYYTSLNDTQEMELSARTSTIDTDHLDSNACKMLIINWNKELPVISADCCQQVMMKIINSNK